HNLGKPVLSPEYDNRNNSMTGTVIATALRRWDSGRPEAVVERAQERRDRIDFALVEPDGPHREIDARPHRGRHIQRRSAAEARVERDRIAQRAEYAVVHERLLASYVAQRRHLEGAAERVVGHARPLRTAQAEVEESRVGIRGNAIVAGHAERVVAEIGEYPVRRHARLRIEGVARGAVALERVGEEPQPFLLEVR